MDVIIKSKHTKLPDSVKAYAEKRLGKLSRHLPSLAEVTVEISHEDTKSAGERYVVQVMGQSNGIYLRAEERADQPLTAIDKASDVMDRQIERHKKRIEAKTRHPRGKAAPVAAEPEEAAAPAPADELRVKRFPMKPMSEDEALEQMELLDHDFFLFLHESTNGYAVVYRRRNGGYGIILPEKP